MPGSYRFNNWHEACQASRFKKAVAKIEIEHKGQTVKAQVVKPLNGDGWLVYHETGVKIRKATTAEIDSRTRWDDF